jgi:tetratricopeptide (TPR) repeat protein
MARIMALNGLLAGLISSLALLVGCGGGDGGGGGPDAASLTAEGWAHYEQGRYPDAIGKFDAAVEADPAYADAYNGLGWSYGKLDSLAEAAANFAWCISNGETGPDPYAGQAPVLRDLDPPQFSNAITAASTALSKSSTYEFSHNEDFDWRDLRLIMAQCYFQLKDYTQALAQVDILDPSNTVDPSGPAFEYRRDLAAAIEDLEEEFGD